MTALEVFKTNCGDLRGLCRSVEVAVRRLTPTVSDLPEGAELPEVNANLMLAVRHLEDARMRLGKAIQYAGDGVSCYDGERAP